MTLKIEWITVIQCRGSDQRYSHAEIEPRLRDIQPGTLLPHPLRPHPRPRGAAAAATAGAGAAAETESTKSTTHLYDLPAVDHAEWWAPPLSPGVGRRCRGFATNVLPLLEIPVCSHLFFEGGWPWRSRVYVIPIDGTCVMVHTMMSDLLFRHETLCNTPLPLSLSKASAARTEFFDA